jgi:hypothetical protein
MPLSKLTFKPGVNRDQTNYASEGGWFETQWVRFRSGFPEKMGGWEPKNFTPYNGVARSLFSWSTTDSSVLLGIGTDTKMYVNAGTAIYDITPIRATFTSPATNNCISTTLGSNVITVTISGYGGITGDYVTLSGVAGPIASIPASEFNTEHQITAVDLNTFTFIVTTAATSTTTTQGGTAITAEFQINIGFTASTAGYGWGTSTWSRLTWGSGSTVPVFFPARLIFQDKFNNDLIFNIRDSDIYYWEYINSFNTRAVLLSSLPGAVAVPRQVGKILFAPSGHLLAFACTNYDASESGPDYLGDYDPLLIRFANVDADIGPDPLNWQPTLTNTAGFLRLSVGSRIVTAIRSKQEILVWTDVSLSSLQFLGTSEVFGLQEVSSATTIFGVNTVIGANNVVYWMGNDKFYIYSGRVDTLPCTLRQYVFTNINRTEQNLFFAGQNAEFNEVIWFYCTANSNEIDRYVVYNYAENIWYFGDLERTAWIDTGVIDFPVAAKGGYVYLHELGNNDGQPAGAPPLPIPAYIQSADIDIEDGDKYMLIRRIIPDVNFTNSEVTNPVTGAPIVPEVLMTVGVRNFPGAASSIINAEGETTAKDVVTSTATINQYTNQVFIRARGRQMNFKISSDNVGTQWQLGMPRVDARPDGLRS